jgi:hypothetical protein
MYRIDRPNVWFQGGKMVIDAGLSLPTRAGLVVYADVSDERVVFGNTFLPYTINVAQTSCTVRSNSTSSISTGEVVVSINRETETGGAAGVRLRVECFFSNGSLISVQPNVTQIIPATDAGVIGKAPRWTFTGLYDTMNPTISPYCNVTLIGLAGVQDQKVLDQLNGMTCRFVLNGGELYADVRNQLGDEIIALFGNATGGSDRSSGYSWWAYLAFVVMAAIPVALLIALVVYAIIQTRKNKASKKKTA